MPLDQIAFVLGVVLLGGLSLMHERMRTQVQESHFRDKEIGFWSWHLSHNLYNEVLAKGPFPAGECAQARITGAEHGELILHLADIAGLASRGEHGLAALSESDRPKFRKLAAAIF